MPEFSRDIVDLVVEYVTLLHTPGLHHAEAVGHLCAPGSLAAGKARDLSAFRVKSFRALRSGDDLVRVRYRAGVDSEPRTVSALFRAKDGKLIDVDADWARESGISLAA